jgi:5,10-methylenetetrahydromethanopterin reductase
MLSMTPRFGVELHQYLDARTVLDEVRLAEEAGYDALWLGDSQLIWRELYVLLGAAAVQTSRITLGIGVTNPVTRLAAVTAGAAITLQELSGNRLVLGLGVGQTSVRTIGLPRASRAQLRTYLETVRALCRGDEVEGMRLAYASAEHAPPIAMAAGGIKMLELAGEIADGAIVSGQLCHPDTRQTLLAAVHRGHELRGGQPARFKLHAGIAAAVDGDRASALDAVRPHAASGLTSHIAALGEEALAARKRLQRSYDYYAHMQPGAKHALDVPDEVIPTFSIAGTPAECRAAAEDLFAAGFDEITIRPYAIKGRSRADMIAAFAREVIAPLRTSV